MTNNGKLFRFCVSSKNRIYFKGNYDKNNEAKKHQENETGAYFSYIDLCNRLNNLKDKTLNVDTDEIPEEGHKNTVYNYYKNSRSKKFLGYIKSKYPRFQSVQMQSKSSKQNLHLKLSSRKDFLTTMQSLYSEKHPKGDFLNVKRGSFRAETNILEHDSNLNHCINLGVTPNLSTINAH